MKFEIGQVFEGLYPPEAAEWCNSNNAYIERIDGKYAIAANPSLPEPTYADLRLAEYPPVGEQLDMIYHDQVDGTDTWLRTIAGIKEKYPKNANTSA